MGRVLERGRELLRRWWLPALGFLAGGLAALHPLSRAIDYPLSLIGCVVLSLAGAVCGALTEPGDGTGTLRDFYSPGLRMVQAVAALLVIPALSSQLSGRPCEPLYGLVFMLVGPLASGLCGVAAGLVSRALLKGPVASLVAAVLLVALSPLLAVGEFFWTPCVRFYGTYFGLYHGAIYDEAVFVEWPYVWLRLWDAAGVGAALLALEARRRQRGVKYAAAGLLCLFSLLAVLGPRLGFIASSAPLEEALSERLAGEHVVVRFAPGGRAAEVAPLMLEDLEFRYRQIQVQLGLDESVCVTAWLYENERQKARLMGAGRTSIAKPWQGQLHVHELQPGAGVLAHELAHVMLAPVSGSVLGLPSGAFGLPRPGLMEGAAVSVERGGDRMTTHQWARAMREVGFLPDVARILDGLGFWGESAQRAYTACGSFVRYLLETRGPGEFLKVYGGAEFEDAYGLPPEDLVAEWNRFLDAVPLSDGDLELARLVFSRPPVFGRVCPYAGGRCIERAVRAVQQKDPQQVLQIAGQAMAMTRKDLQTGLKLVRLLFTVGSADGGLKVADLVAGALPPDAGVAASAAVELARADAYWLRGDGETAAALYQRLAEGPAGTWLAAPLRLRLLLAGRALDEEVVPLLLDACPGKDALERATAVLSSRKSGLPERFKAAAVLARRPSSMVEAETELQSLVPRLSAEPTLAIEAGLLRLRLLCLTDRTAQADKLARSLIEGTLTPAQREEALDWQERAGWKRAR